MRDLDRLLQQAAADGRRAARPLPAGDVRSIGAKVRRVRAVTGATVAALALTGVVALVSTASVPDASPPAGPATPSLDPTSTPTGTSTEEPAPPPGSSAPQPSTTSPPPSTSPPMPPQEPILAGNLLRADDLEQIGPPEAAWAWVESAGPLPRCTPEPSGVAVETGDVRFEIKENPFYAVTQRAEAYASEDEAAARLADLRAAIGQCAEESDDVDLFAAFTLTGVGDAGFIVETVEPDEGLVELPAGGTPDASLYATTRFAQTGRVVTWTVWTVGKNEYHNYPDVGDLGTAVDRLCGPADGSCSGAAGLTITYPVEHAGTDIPPGGFSDLI